MYLHGRVAPGVIQPFSEAWTTFSSCKPLVTERRLELTFQYSENLQNVHVAMVGQWAGCSGQQAAGGAWFKIWCAMIGVWVELRAIEK